MKVYVNYYSIDNPSIELRLGINSTVIHTLSYEEASELKQKLEGCIATIDYNKEFMKDRRE